MTIKLSAFLILATSALAQNAIQLHSQDSSPKTFTIKAPASMPANVICELGTADFGTCAGSSSARPQAILVFQSAAWHAYAADGSVISIVGSTTCGLQEAITASVAANGGGGLWMGAGLCSATTQIHIPPTIGYHLIVDAEVTFTSAISSNDGMWVDSALRSTFEFNAAVNYAGSGHAVTLRPVNLNPGTSIHEMARNHFVFQEITSSTNLYSGTPAAQSTLHLVGDATDVGTGDINNDTFDIRLIQGGLVGVSIELLPIGGAGYGPGGSVAENIYNIGAMAFNTDTAIITSDPLGYQVATHSIWTCPTIILRGDLGVNNGIVMHSGTMGNTFTIGAVSGYPPIAPTAKVISLQGDASDNYVFIAGLGGGVIDTDTVHNSTNSVEGVLGRLYPSVSNLQGVDATSLTVTGVAGTGLQNWLTSPSTFGSYLEIGPTTTPVELVGAGNGDFIQSFYGGAADVFQSIAAGAVAHTLVLDSGNVGVLGDVNLTGSGAYKVGGTTAIDSSRNGSFVGLTIGTLTGCLQATSGTV